MLHEGRVLLFRCATSILHKIETVEGPAARRILEVGIGRVTLTVVVEGGRQPSGRSISSPLRVVHIKGIQKVIVVSEAKHRVNFASKVGHAIPPHLLELLFGHARRLSIVLLYRLV